MQVVYIARLCPYRSWIGCVPEWVNAHLHFVADLAEWVNMHDLHRPYAMGPPGKEQRCAHVEDEHSSKEAVTCNKLFPRKVIEAGMEEVAEDPRRRDLYKCMAKSVQ